MRGVGNFLPLNQKRIRILDAHLLSHAFMIFSKARLYDVFAKTDYR